MILQYIKSKGALGLLFRVTVYVLKIKDFIYFYFSLHIYRC